MRYLLGLAVICGVATGVVLVEAKGNDNDPCTWITIPSVPRPLAAPKSPDPRPPPSFLSEDGAGAYCNEALVANYSRLCLKYPEMGTKPGDGVWLSLDQSFQVIFHLSWKAKATYDLMVERERKERK